MHIECSQYNFQIEKHSFILPVVSLSVHIYPRMLGHTVLGPAVPTGHLYFHRQTDKTPLKHVQQGNNGADWSRYNSKQLRGTSLCKKYLFGSRIVFMSFVCVQCHPLFLTCTIPLPGLPIQSEYRVSQKKRNIRFCVVFDLLLRP